MKTKTNSNQETGTLQERMARSRYTELRQMLEEGKAVPGSPEPRHASSKATEGTKGTTVAEPAGTGRRPGPSPKLLLTRR